MDSEWEIYSFEVNPETYKLMNHDNFPNVNFINKGVWVDNIDKHLSIESQMLKICRTPLKS